MRLNALISCPGDCSANQRCEIPDAELKTQIEAESFPIIVDLVRDGYDSTIHTADHLDPGKSGVRQA